MNIAQIAFVGVVLIIFAILVVEWRLKRRAHRRAATTPGARGRDTAAGGGVSDGPVRADIGAGASTGVSAGVLGWLIGGGGDTASGGADGPSDGGGFGGGGGDAGGM